MNKSKIDIRNFQQNKLFNFSQPIQGWGIIIVFIFVNTLLLGMGSSTSKFLFILFPIGSFIVGCKLYFRHPILYAGFVWWLFFLTPLIRRVADFRGGAFTDPGPMLLAPYAAALVCSYTLYSNLPKTREQGSSYFILAITSVAYGCLVGLINSSNPSSVIVALLEWVSPLLFGYHLYIDWRRYPEYCRNLQKVFLWGVLIMGVYGIYQYLVAPEWDSFWLLNAPNIQTSAGKPEPLGIRVWSTMNSPGTFGCFMATGLLILFSCKNVLVMPAAGLGVLSFLLSMVRTGWIGFLLGMIYISTSIKPKQQLVFVITIVALATLVIPLATMEPFASTISARVETLSDIANDGSLQERQFLYRALIEDAFKTYIGKGLGLSGGFDSAVLVTLFELGWIGSIPYIGSLILLVISIFKSPKATKDIFASIIRAIIIQSIFYLFAGATMKGAVGMLLWSFLGMGLASRNYYYDSQLTYSSKFN
jgi:hypothetical protein